MKNNIAEFRKLRGLTQQQLADKVNVAYRQIQRWEHGIVVPSVDVAISLAKALKTTVEKLYPAED